MLLTCRRDLMLAQGDAGYILLCSNQTKGWVASLKMEGSVRCVAFSPDSTTLISGGSYHFPLLMILGIFGAITMHCQRVTVHGLTCRGQRRAVPLGSQDPSLSSSPR